MPYSNPAVALFLRTSLKQRLACRTHQALGWSSFPC